MKISNVQAKYPLTELNETGRHDILREMQTPGSTPGRLHFQRFVVFRECRHFRRSGV